SARSTRSRRAASPVTLDLASPLGRPNYREFGNAEGGTAASGVPGAPGASILCLTIYPNKTYHGNGSSRWIASYVVPFASRWSLRRGGRYSLLRCEGSV